MKAFAEEAAFIDKYPEEVALLKTIEVNKTDWGIKEPLLRINLASKIDFFDDLRRYWHNNFFTDHYLQYDTPL